ncbi:MAG TPA: hypothetical protein VGP75_13245 [Yoonia sp.]|nr:hypothetical protein [Yoonia sp.]
MMNPAGNTDHADNRGRVLRHEFQKLRLRPLFADLHFTRHRSTMNLKNTICQIDAPLFFLMVGVHCCFSGCHDPIFNQERHLYSRDTFKLNRNAALTGQRQL